MINRLSAAALCAVFLSACSSAHQRFVPNVQNAPAGSLHSQTGATMLPGTGATMLPGTGATMLPGANLGCAVPGATSGQAACTVAINTNVAVNGNPSAMMSQLLGLAPRDLASAYAIPSAPGGTVAIVDAYDDPSAEFELETYRATYGLPSCTSDNGCFRKVNQSGDSSSYPATNTGWATEIALDLEMVSAVCPSCSIILVEANSSSIDDLGAGVDTAARMGAVAVSNSYYAAEYAGETTEDVHYKHPGIAITASSGDAGFMSYPAASQYVTAVSGTSLAFTNGAWTQQPWQYSGHGCSAYVSRPHWQTPALTGCTSRSANDVAVVADPQTGVSMFSVAQGGWVVAGGTSVGAPIVAAMYALSGNLASPSFSYDHPSQFTTVGSGPYDAYDGLGSPNGLGGL